MTTTSNVEVVKEEYFDIGIDEETMTAFNLTLPNNKNREVIIVNEVDNYAIQEVVPSSPNDTSITKPVFKEKTINNEKNKIVSKSNIKMKKFTYLKANKKNPNKSFEESDNDFLPG